MPESENHAQGSYDIHDIHGFTIFTAFQNLIDSPIEWTDESRPRLTPGP